LLRVFPPNRYGLVETSVFKIWWWLKKEHNMWSCKSFWFSKFLRETIFFLGN